MLNQPALTGMDPADLEALAAAIKVPFGARREHALFVHRGGRRSRAEGAGHHPKITIMDHVLALRLRDHLNLPVSLTGAMLGVDRTTISHAVSLARQLIAGNGIPLPAAAPPPGTRLRTPAELLQYAETAGIDLTIPQIRPYTPKYSRRRRAEPRDAPETAN